MVTYGVVWLDERVVDGNDLNVAVLDAALQSAPIVSSLQGTALALASLTYALRKTIRPILPKPLMPHCCLCISMCLHILSRCPNVLDLVSAHLDNHVCDSTVVVWDRSCQELEEVDEAVVS